MTATTPSNTTIGLDERDEAALSDADKAHLVAQYDRLINLIKTELPVRADKLLAMYDWYLKNNRILAAPASGRTYFHNCYPGGYITHILRVIANAKLMTIAYRKNGAEIDYTEEELVFAAMHHDLGKLGDLDVPYYLHETSDWHRQNHHTLYKHNEDCQYMTVYDRTMYMLHHFEIPMTKKEMLGIKLADGVFDESNERYLKTFKRYPIRTNLIYVIHAADYMSMVCEKDIQMRRELGTVIV